MMAAVVIHVLRVLHTVTTHFDFVLNAMATLTVSQMDLPAP